MILRKRDDLPCYIIVKPEIAHTFSGAFEAHVTINDSAPFHRRIHPWGKGSDAYFFNLTQVQCTKAGVRTGDRCRIAISPV
ncbi:hypothetical protein [Aliiroseovarius sp. S253]|uniref:hypothetical protein n=1 Tax=Aliiroseovarius sp. S253 TaxID=3415133 RepID=UPI003C79BC75